jgi:hypothetical protein
MIKNCGGAREQADTTCFRNPPLKPDQSQERCILNNPIGNLGILEKNVHPTGLSQ